MSEGLPAPYLRTYRPAGASARRGPSGGGTTATATAVTTTVATATAVALATTTAATTTAATTTTTATPATSATAVTATVPVGHAVGGTVVALIDGSCVLVLRGRGAGADRSRGQCADSASSKAGGFVTARTVDSFAERSNWLVSELETLNGRDQAVLEQCGREPFVWRSTADSKRLVRVRKRREYSETDYVDSCLNVASLRAHSCTELLGISRPTRAELSSGGRRILRQYTKPHPRHRLQLHASRSYQWTTVGTA